MDSIKCFDTVKKIVEEANKQFAPAKADPNDMEILEEEYCTAIDFLIKDFNCSAFEVKIDPMYRTVNISLESAYITFTRNHVFSELMKRSVLCNVTTTANGENLRFTFVLPSLWENREEAHT